MSVLCPTTDKVEEAPTFSRESEQYEAPGYSGNTCGIAVVHTEGKTFFRINLIQVWGLVRGEIDDITEASTRWAAQFRASKEHLRLLDDLDKVKKRRAAVSRERELVARRRGRCKCSNSSTLSGVRL